MEGRESVFATVQECSFIPFPQIPQTVTVDPYGNPEAVQLCCILIHISSCWKNPILFFISLYPFCGVLDSVSELMALPITLCHVSAPLERIVYTSFYLLFTQPTSFGFSSPLLFYNSL